MVLIVVQSLPKLLLSYILACALRALVGIFFHWERMLYLCLRLSRTIVKLSAVALVIDILVVLSPLVPR